jgi:enterochelin esterase-like enzyme
MRTFSLFIITILFVSNTLVAQETKRVTSVINTKAPKISSGTIKHYENFESKFVVTHNVDVWMPDGYNAKNKYAVLYMNDGEEMFDTSSTSVKNGWAVDETVTRLLKEDKIKKCIVVAIWSKGHLRHGEYFPQKPFETFSTKEQDSMYQVKFPIKQMLQSKVQSDNYLKFLVKELKPFIDKNYSTLKDINNTFIGGSSMGALISWYAVCEYPKVFGGAACMSTHWPGLLPSKNNFIPNTFNQYLQANAPSAKNHKFYFDYGSIQADWFYKPLQTKVDLLFETKGYTVENYVSKEFKGDDHSSKSWKKRLDIPLLFLLKK